MKYLYNFNNFINEARVSDMLYGDEEFEYDEPLIKEIKLDYQDILLKINYNDKSDHIIKEKIKNRTNLKSISEFNLFLYKALNEIIPDSISNEILYDGKYEIYFKDRKFSIIIGYRENDLFGKHEITVVTIMSGNVINCENTIIIDDENFLF
jgi:hypothetical protein